MRRPSVLFINRVYPPVHGATGRVLRDLARAMAREGWQVTVLTTGNNDSRERDDEVRVIRVKASEIPSGPLWYIKTWFSLFKTASKLPAPHLMVTMTDPMLFVVAGYILQKLKKTRHVHWCQDLYPDLLPQLGVKIPGLVLNPLKALSRFAMKKCDKVVVIGRCMAKYLTKQGIPPGRITVIPNWPDMELVGPAGREGFNDVSYSPDQESVIAHEDKMPPHRRYNDQIKDGPKFRVLYAGNIGRAHPVMPVLDAAEVLKEEHPEIEFVFVGNGPAFERLAEERAKRHLNNIKLLPFQPVSRLRALMESGDVHLVSMKHDVAGMLMPSKVYSALAVGRPCIFIGPAQCEAAKVIRDFNAGVVLRQGQTGKLVEEIKRLRLNGDDWFAAQHGAAEAGKVFVPKESINAWIERAWSLVEADVRT